MALNAYAQGATLAPADLEPAILDSVAAARALDMPRLLRAVFMPLASLRLTVALLGLGLLLVFIGTLAQTRYDMQDVLEKYFRTFFVWVEFDIFFPAAFFPEWSKLHMGLQLPGGWMWDGFPFPGGYVIGLAMFANLLAAHSLRFTVQTRGTRLWAGLGVIALGLLITALVIASGENKQGIQAAPLVSYGALWTVFKFGVLVLSFIAATGTIWSFAKLDPARRIERWALLVCTVLLAAASAWLLMGGEMARVGDSGMRILWQLLKACAASAVLLVGCYTAFKKRAGIVLLHFGIGLLMGYELWVARTHVEAQVMLEEASPGSNPERTMANWAQDIRELELAVIERGAGEGGGDRTIAVPEGALLRRSAKDDNAAFQRVRNDRLPFDVQVLAFYRNSTTQPLRPSESNLADAGQGKFWLAAKAPPVTGVDSEKENHSAAYVRFTHRQTGEPLSTHLLSIDQTYLAQWAPTELDRLDEVKCNGKTYEVYLRFKRVNKPYSVQLLDVHRTNYIGTATPRDYSSDVNVHLVNREAGVDFDGHFHIWMNNPLRLSGDTLYQSGYHPTDGVFFLERTTLQIVSNGGWMTPYVCCVIVGFGMLFQFGVALLRFLNRQASEAAKYRPAGGIQMPVAAALSDVERKPPARQVAELRQAKKPRRGESRPLTKGEQQGLSITPGTERALSRWFPWVVLVLCAAMVASLARPASIPKGEMDIHAFGKLPVVYEGRVKPLDTLARQHQRAMSDYETARRVKHEGPPEEYESQPAIRWLLDLITDKERADEYQVFKIDNHDVRHKLGLPMRKGLRFSFKELQESLDVLQAEGEVAEAAFEKSPRSLTPYQRKLLDLFKKTKLYVMLRGANAVPPKADDANSHLALLAHWNNVARVLARGELERVPFAIPAAGGTRNWEALTTAAGRSSIQQWAREHNAKTLDQFITAFVQAMRTDGTIDRLLDRRRQEDLVHEISRMLAEQAGLPRNAPQEDVQRAVVERFGKLSEAEREAIKKRAQEHLDSDRSVAAAQIEANLESSLQQSIPVVLGKAKLTDAPNASAIAMTRLLHAYRDGDVARFDTALAECQAAVAATGIEAGTLRGVRFEAFFNNFSPFFYASWLSVLAFVLMAMAWLGWSRPLQRASFWLMVLVLVVHAFGLVARIYISGRPPITNLYTTAVFIGWAAIVLGLVLELIFGLGLGNLIASVAGFATLQVAHRLSMDGDTFTVLQAVLDTQFWLATHVVCINLGYATTFVAGLLGLYYVLAGVLSKALTPELGRTLTRMTYGILCFAIFFSFVGTVLGGLWADDSWGRFWGWDPKENGALMIVIWNAIVLHARWGGMVKERGLAVLAIGGNIITSWSWFGVNELGIGLHSYGFTEGVLMALGVFVATQAIAIIVGSLPKSWWWSNSAGERPA